MGLIDWFLGKSSDFKSFLDDYRKHEKKTKNSFRNVKRDNMLIVQKLRQYEDKIDKLLKAREEPIRIYRKKR